MNFPLNGLTVLIVDDEEMVLTLGRSMLERKGYVVKTATSGESALEICREANLSLDGLIVDFTMPGMNGRETVSEIRKIFPTIPALISSGYSDEEINAEMAGVPFNGLIHKPYRQDSLVSALEQALSRDDAASPQSGHIMR